MAKDIDLLYIYDADMDWATRSSNRHDADMVVGIKGGIKGLKDTFEKFLSDGLTFRRVTFETHGNEGAIFFGDEKYNRQIDAKVLKSSFTGYDALFPEYAKLMFSGCNVADGAAGWPFLETAAQVFLTRSGGKTAGWTSVGFAWGANLPGILGGVIYDHIYAGHVWHPWGDLHTVWMGPGGSPILHYTN